MKKTVCILTVIALLLSLCGCGMRTPKKGVTTTSAPAETTTRAQTTALSTKAETTTQATTVAPSETREATLYADYLKNGGYEELLFEDYDEDPETVYEAEAAMADVEGDGVFELLIRITNKTFMGVRGYASVTALLGVRNGKVEQLGYADYPGGSGGGDYLNFKYDTVEKKHVLEYEEFVRDGMFASTMMLYYFDTSRYAEQDKEYGMGGDGFVKFETETTLRTDSIYKEGIYAEDAERVLRETNLCKQEDGFVTFFMLNGSYISEDAFDAWCNRFVEPTDPAYQMKPVTMENPIPSD